MREIINVGYKQVYDLVFRARNARLNSAAYVLDFYEWLRAGIAYNTRGFEESTRKISYFAKLYNLLVKGREEGIQYLRDKQYILEEALVFYYEDIFEVYQDHLKSKQNEAKQKQSRVAPDFGELIVVPCFEGVPELLELFPQRHEKWDSYVCENTGRFLERVNSAYLKEGTGLYSCMSMMYDYGLGHKGHGIVLEVDLWNNAE